MMSELAGMGKTIFSWWNSDYLKGILYMHAPGAEFCPLRVFIEDLGKEVSGPAKSAAYIVWKILWDLLFSASKFLVQTPRR